MSKSMTTKVERFDSEALSKPEKEARPLNRYRKVLAPIVPGIGLWFLPTAERLTPNAWYYFALFGGAARDRRAVPAVSPRLKSHRFDHNRWTRLCKFRRAYIFGCRRSAPVAL